MGQLIAHSQCTQVPGMERLIPGEGRGAPVFLNPRQRIVAVEIHTPFVPVYTLFPFPALIYGHADSSFSLV